MAARLREETDIDTRYASFCLRPLTDEEVWALSAASMVLPSGNPGCAAFLAYVSGTRGFADQLREYSQMAAASAGASRYIGQRGIRRRAYVEGYNPRWGVVAAQDGLEIATGNHYEVPNARDRVKALGCGRQGYERIRDFVGGLLVDAICEFRHALRWALGDMRDRVFESRWETITGLKWSGRETYGKMGYPQGNCYPLFAKGCDRTLPVKDMAAENWDQPETLYPAINVSDCWNTATAREMRSAPVTIIYKPCLGINRAATDE
jgi:hypothetical protein